MLIQVTWDMSETKTFERELAGLKSAMHQLSIPNGFIITADDEMTIEDAIQVIPAWKWLLA
jgi:predicted AAA+ superfamily ATPase